MMGGGCRKGGSVVKSALGGKQNVRYWEEMTESRQESLFDSVQLSN